MFKSTGNDCKVLAVSKTLKNNSHEVKHFIIHKRYSRTGLAALCNSLSVESSA